MILESATKSCVKNRMATNIVYLDIICVIAEIISEIFLEILLNYYAINLLHLLKF